MKQNTENTAALLTQNADTLITGGNPMRKNRSMRSAAALTVLTLITTCLIGGTFAKYVTTAGDNVAARVAAWGFEKTGEISIDNLFAASYDNVQSSNEELVIAPGTTGEAEFGFAYTSPDGIAAPEVAYTFTVDTEGSVCDDAIKANDNIRFYLDDEMVLLTWDELMAALKGLSGDASGVKTYEAGSLPEAFADADGAHTIGWVWTFYTDDAADVVDTAMGNMDELDDIELHISITAEQID